MRRVIGLGGNAFARAISNILDEFMKLPNNGLSRTHQGVILAILDDTTGTTLSVWEIGNPPRVVNPHIFPIECGHRLIEDRSLSNSQSSNPDTINDWAVAVRIKIRSKKRIAAIYGLTREANESILLLAAVGKDYLAPEVAAKMLENSQNGLIRRLKRQFLRR